MDTKDRQIIELGSRVSYAIGFLRGAARWPLAPEYHTLIAKAISDLESEADFYASLTWEQAREHLNSYTVEEVRQLLENGAFGERMTADLKVYLTQRILDPDFR